MSRAPTGARGADDDIGSFIRNSGAIPTQAAGVDNLVPNLDTTRRFLNLLDPVGIFTFQTFDDSKAKRPSLSRVLHGTLDDHVDQLRRLNRQGASINVMVNEGDGIVHEGAKTCRHAASVTRVRALMVDLDGAPLDPVIARLPPNIIVLTSPGRWHAYWFTLDCPLHLFNSFQKQIASMFHGDESVVDLPRVMRLPGFIHQKGKPFLSLLVYPTARQTVAQRKPTDDGGKEHEGTNDDLADDDESKH